ncbi:MAG: hypothetical protein R3E88_08595 [Myxococcota bacterium]
MLRPIAGDDAGLWTIDHPLAMPGGIEMGTRTTVVRLADGALALLAPGPLGDDDVAALRARGPVRAIVAPNAFHHLFLAAAVAAFPDAERHAAKAVCAKYPALGLAPLAATPAPRWAGVLEQVHVDGMPRMDETVFFHPASRTLVLTDLCFHVRRAANARTKLFLRVAGAWDRFGPSRLARSMIRDRRALRASLDRLLAFDPERIVVTHGDLVERDGREALRSAFAGVA